MDDSLSGPSSPRMSDSSAPDWCADVAAADLDTHVTGLPPPPPSPHRTATEVSTGTAAAATASAQLPAPVPPTSSPSDADTTASVARCVVGRDEGLSEQAPQSPASSANGMSAVGVLCATPATTACTSPSLYAAGVSFSVEESALSPAATPLHMVQPLPLALPRPSAQERVRGQQRSAPLTASRLQLRSSSSSGDAVSSPPPCHRAAARRRRPSDLRVADDARRPVYLRLVSPCTAATAASGTSARRWPFTHNSSPFSPVSEAESRGGGPLPWLPPSCLALPAHISVPSSPAPTPHVPALDFSAISDGPLVRDGEVLDLPWWGSAEQQRSGLPSPYLSITGVACRRRGSSGSFVVSSGYDDDDDGSEEDAARYDPDSSKAEERQRLSVHGSAETTEAHHAVCACRGDDVASSDEDWIVPNPADAPQDGRARTVTATPLRTRGALSAAAAASTNAAAAAARRSRVSGCAPTPGSREAAAAAYAGRRLKKDLSRGFLRGSVCGSSGGGGRSDAHRGSRAGTAALGWVASLKRILSLAGVFVMRLGVLYLSSLVVLRTRTAMAHA